jgi:hypothetical protein
MIFVFTPPSVSQSNCALKAERVVRDGTLCLSRAVHFLEKKRKKQFKITVFFA